MEQIKNDIKEIKEMVTELKLMVDKDQQQLEEKMEIHEFLTGYFRKNPELKPDNFLFFY